MLELRDVTVPDDQYLQATLDTLRHVEARAAIARCAEAVVIMQMLFDTTRHASTFAPANNSAHPSRAFKHCIIVWLRNMRLSNRRARCSIWR